MHKQRKQLAFKGCDSMKLNTTLHQCQCTGPCTYCQIVNSDFQKVHVCEEIKMLPFTVTSLLRLPRVLIY